jgi:outer membrane protein TolC
MLPNFTISGNCGHTVLDFASLFSSANLFWTVAGNATQTVFDGFTLLHNKRAAEAAYDQAAWNYRTTVIIALRNVVDALRAIQDDAGALQAARANERLSVGVAPEVWGSQTKRANAIPPEAGEASSA